MNNTDIEWEKWGKKDPYFGVLAHDRFRTDNITEETMKEFFDSGREHINHVLDMCRHHIDSNFVPKRTLDFGCGTGRLILPLAEVSEHVVGLDVSDSMLKEALINCNKNSIKNVRLLKTDDNLSCLEGRFDFIHSFIVFQHVPVERGKRIFKRILNHLEYEGIGAIQFTYSKKDFHENWGLQQPEDGAIKKSLRTLKQVIKNITINEPPPQDPEMQMNSYNLNELLFTIQSKGIKKIHVEYTDHGGDLGVILYFQNSKRSITDHI